VLSAGRDAFSGRVIDGVGRRLTISWYWIALTIEKMGPEAAARVKADNVGWLQENN
jgi:hypothetical protein